MTFSLDPSHNLHDIIILFMASYFTEDKECIQLGNDMLVSLQKFDSKGLVSNCISKVILYMSSKDIEIVFY